MLHLADIEEQSNVAVKCNDTDVFIILLGNIEKFQTKNVWIEHGFVSNNSLRFLNVNLLAGNLVSRICKALPSFHAFTGCDYSPAFFGKGKKKPLCLLLSDSDVQLVLSEAGESEYITDELMSGLEKFTCMIYGKKKCTSVDEALVESFFKAYKPNTRSRNLLEIIRGADGSSFPPCSKILHQHIQ